MGLSIKSAGSALGNFTAQMITNEGSWKEKFMDVNFTGVIASAGIGNPIGGEVIGSGFKSTLTDITDRQSNGAFQHSFFLGDMKFDKFGSNVLVAGVFGKVADFGLNNSGIYEKAFETSMKNILSKSAQKGVQFGTSSFINGLLNVPSNIISDLKKQ